MSKQLHWKDGPGYNKYLATKDALTNQILAEVDGFVADSIQPNMAMNQVTAALDKLLNRQRGSTSNSVALTTNLPDGPFLIIGVELERGGSAVEENAISFRAYQNQNGKFVFTAATNDIHSSDATNSALCCVYAKSLSSPPVTGEFWSVAWAVVPPQSPYTVALRLFTFDGRQFHTLWAPPDILTVVLPLRQLSTYGILSKFSGPAMDNVVEITPTGFTVNRAIDSTGGAAHSPNVIIHEQYALSVNGPVKTTETQELNR
jgi:hypothetical protein